MNEWDDFLDEPSGRQGDNNNLVELLNKLLRNWYWFALCAVLGLGGAWLYLRYATPIYAIHAKLLVTDEQKGGGMGDAGILGDLSGLLGVKSNVDNEVEVLRTHDLMRMVVDTLESHITIRRQGRIRHVELDEPPYDLQLGPAVDSLGEALEFEIHPLSPNAIRLVGETWQEEVQLGVPFTLPELGSATVHRTEAPVEETTYLVSVVAPEDRAEAFLENLEVSVTNKQTSTIDLSFRHAIKKKGIALLETLLDTYVAIILEDKNQVADSTLAFIDERLRHVSGALGGTEDAISHFKQQGGLTDVSEQARMLLENTSAYTRDLAESEGQLLMLDELERYLDNPDDVRVLPALVGFQEPGFSALVQRYNTLILDRERLLLSHTPDNPYVQNLDGQILGLRSDMRSSIRSSRRQLEATKNNLQRRVDRLESEIRAVPATERDYIDLSRQQQLQQELYIFLQQKREETAIGKMANISNAKVIDSPRADRIPVSPRQNLILAIGLLAGLAIPFTLISLRDMLNVRVRGHEDIQARTDIPVASTIGHSDEDSPIVVSETARSPVAEQFRTLRTNLSFYGVANEQQAILTTSSMSGEGKSFIALNLALSLALTGKRVALLELDLRKPALSSKLGVQYPQGFTNYVVDPQLELSDIVHATDYENLYFVSSGPIPPNPAELLLQSRTEGFFALLKEEFDVIVIDTAPIGLVTDAQLLSAYADTCLYVVRQDVTYKKQLDIPRDLVSNKKIKNLKLILNDAKASKGYGYQGYGYGYGYGYYGEEKKRRWFG